MMKTNNAIAERTPGTADFCEYTFCSRGGHRRAVGELRAHYTGTHASGIPWAMCEVHISPVMHPKTLRDRLVRWTNGAK